MPDMSAASKSETNVTISGDLLEAARLAEQDNVSAIGGAALADMVKTAKRENWLTKNRDAIEWSRAWFKDNGLPLARSRTFRAE